MRWPIPIAPVDDSLADPLDAEFRELERQVAAREAQAKCIERGYHGQRIWIWGSADVTCVDCGSPA